MISGQRGVRVWGEEVVTSCCHRFRRGEFPIEERLVGRTTLRAVSMMGTLAIIEGQIGIEIVLQFRHRLVDLLAELDAVKLFLDGSMEAFTEAVGLR
jgi:hypothetical protein